jgi:hypothetical protein
MPLHDVLVALAQDITMHHITTAAELVMPSAVPTLQSDPDSAGSARGHQ